MLAMAPSIAVALPKLRCCLPSSLMHPAFPRRTPPCPGRCQTPLPLPLPCRVELQGAAPPVPAVPRVRPPGPRLPLQPGAYRAASWPCLFLFFVLFCPSPCLVGAFCPAWPGCAPPAVPSLLSPARPGTSRPPRVLQFGSQEPGSHAEIEEFVLTHYGAQFPLMSKVEVNGPGQHPIWAWLKLNAPAVTGRGGSQLAS